jgi:RNA polymerase sigma factor (sigma-70 family)
MLRSRYSSLSSADHEDIIQNVSIKLINNGLTQFNGTTRYELLGYFRTITNREALTFLRQTVRQRSNTSLDQPFECDPESSLLDILQDDRLDPETIAEINDLYLHALEQLTIRERQILLYKIEGYKDREIAELLDISLGSVAGSYNRIKELLRQTLLIALPMIMFGRNLLLGTSL